MDLSPLTNLEIALRDAFVPEGLSISVRQFLDDSHAAFAHAVMTLGLADREDEDEMWDIRMEVMDTVSSFGTISFPPRVRRDPFRRMISVGVSRIWGRCRRRPFCR